MPGLLFLFRPASLSSSQLEFEDGEDRLSKFSAVFDSTYAAYLLGALQLALLERLPESFLGLQSRGVGDTVLAPPQFRLCQDGCGLPNRHHRTNCLPECIDGAA